MKFKVKDMDIATGGPLVAVLNEKDAEELDLHSEDRVLIGRDGKKVTCILNISQSNRAVPKGEIGLYEEVLDKLKVKHTSTVKLFFTGKPESVHHIRDKLYGKELNYEECFHIMRDITEDKLSSIEKTYFVAAGFSNGWTAKEVVNMTKAMVNTGQRIKFSGITLDKHCIGGVPGNRTTMIVVPIIAAAGFTMPKTSSRAITSPAGTADTMECLAKVEMSEKKIKEVIRKTKGCIVHGGSMNLAPADDKIIKVEHPLSIDAEGQLLASVMAKKYSVSANHVLIDIPMGPDVKVRNLVEAKRLKRKFEMIGKHLKINTKVVITDGRQPIGYGIGPCLEAEDVIAVFENKPTAPKDLKDKAVTLAGILLKMTGKVKNGKKEALRILESGEAWRKFKEIVQAQGATKKAVCGGFHYAVRSGKSGIVRKINNKTIAKVARIAGAPKDKGAGLIINKKIGDKVEKKDVLFTIVAESEFKFDLAKEIARKDKGYIIK